MTATLLRGRVLTFMHAPQGVDDHGSYRYEEDGAILMREGRIADMGEYGAIAPRAGDDVAIVDHRPHLVMPGLIDAHAHMPQMQVIASFGTELLEWLNRYTFPEEARFADPDHASRIAGLFLDELLRQGTTSVAAYCSVHRQSADALFGQALARDMAIVAGKVMMDCHAPDGVTDTPQSGYDDTKALIAKWHGKGRLGYAVTPRFALTSSPEQLEMAGALMREHPDLHMQTHLSENHAEIARAAALYPAAGDYTDIYAGYGLLGPRALLGHCIHLSEREADILSETGSVAVFCPTSNLFLGSGLFDWQGRRKRSRPVRTAIATDVGGGTNYSMLRTMDEGYKVIALNGEKIDPLSSFWQATLGNAEALSMVDSIGTLEPGSDADIVVLDARATPAMALRMERVETLAEELFLLQTLGDDRAVVETYVAGKAMKSRLGPQID